MKKTASQIAYEVLRKIAEGNSWDTDPNWLQQKAQPKVAPRKTVPVSEEQAMALQGKHTPMVPPGNTPRQNEHEMYVAQGARAQRMNPGAPLNSLLQSRINATGPAAAPPAVAQAVQPAPGALAMRTKQPR